MQLLWYLHRPCYKLPLFFCFLFFFHALIFWLWKNSTDCPLLCTYVCYDMITALMLSNFNRCLLFCVVFWSTFLVIDSWRGSMVPRCAGVSSHSGVCWEAGGEKHLIQIGGWPLSTFSRRFSIWSQRWVHVQQYCMKISLCYILLNWSSQTNVIYHMYVYVLASWEGNYGGWIENSSNSQWLIMLLD